MQQEDSPKCWASDTKGVWIVGKAKKHIATDAVVALDLLSLLGFNSESRIGWIGRTSPRPDFPGVSVYRKEPR